MLIIFGKWGKEVKINPGEIEVVVAPSSHRRQQGTGLARGDGDNVDRMLLSPPAAVTRFSAPKSKSCHAREHQTLGAKGDGKRGEEWLLLVKIICYCRAGNNNRMILEKAVASTGSICGDIEKGRQGADISFLTRWAWFYVATHQNRVDNGVFAFYEVACLNCEMSFAVTLERFHLSYCVICLNSSEKGQLCVLTGSKMCWMEMSNS